MAAFTKILINNYSIEDCDITVDGEHEQIIKYGNFIYNDFMLYNSNVNLRIKNMCNWSFMKNKSSTFNEVLDLMLFDDLKIIY